MKSLPLKTVLLVICAACAGIIASALLPGGSGSDTPPTDTNDSPGSKKRPERIVCMSPSVTELTFALEQGDRVVGVSQHTTYPPEALGKPRCGGFVNPNFERIMELQPDLIVTQGLAEDVQSFTAEHDIEFLSLDLTDLNSIYTAIERLGNTYQCPDRAKSLEQDIRTELQQIRNRVEDERSPQTFLVIGRAPDSLQNLTTIGPGSYLADVLRVAGGENIFNDLSQDYATINKEVLTERQPGVILELRGEGMMGEASREQIQQTWSQMPALPAVKNDRVYVIDKTYALIPGPRVGELARDIAGKLHPPDNSK